MKKFTFLTLFTALTFAAAIIISGCTKEGPQGPAGEDGQDGIDGEDGTAGCIQCHDDSQQILAASLQWEASLHATGGNFERNGSSCAPCHTSQGFLDVIETGAMESDAALSNPLPPNCYTCHNIHETYTPEDWALTKTEPVEFWINGEVADQGKGNVCSQCHQPRVPSPMPDMAALNDSVSIGNFRWGPHYGTQSVILAGTAGFEFDGSAGYNNSAHANIENTCVTCHMADPYGVQAGGHTMDMTYLYHGSDAVNEAGCFGSGCHAEGDDLPTMIEAMETEVEGHMEDLRQELLAQGLIDDTDHIVPTTMTNEQLGAVWNFLLVHYDGSHGMHNKRYTRALLLNSLEALQN